jgi:hypothetical protein
MFSISTSEFSDLSEFVNKLKASSLEKPEFDAIREWCSEKGFQLHFSKTGPASEPNIFYTLKYDRAKLTTEQYSTVGRLRSVVFDRDGNICCVAPPKMLTLVDDLKTQEVNSVSSTLSAEELVEGIMVNLFWKVDTATTHGKWYIATKSCVGEVSFDHILQAEAEEQAQVQAQAAATPQVQPDAPTEGQVDASETVAGEPRGFQKLSVQEVLRRRICEVFSLLPGGLDNIPKQYCYSFVVQHPKNQIVNTITVPKLYLIAVYQLSASDSGVGVNAIRINRDIFSANFGGSVAHMPSTLTCISDDIETEAVTATATFAPHTVSDYCNMYASADTRSVELPGVVFVDKDTGFCYKKRNPKYESVKKRKGMEQKLLAQYLQLRKDRAIDEYLKYHQQHSRAFHQFRERLHEYTQRLYDAYIEHYVKKATKPLKEYDRELKTHMYKLHYEVYLANMKPAGTFVTKHTVINYVNQLVPAQQLACLNASPSSTTEQRSSADVHSSSSDAQQKQFHQKQNKQIERTKPALDTETKSGFRSARPSRGGRTVPSLSIEVPNNDDGERSVHVKGSKTTGSVKVQNQFAGLDVD